VGRARKIAGVHDERLHDLRAMAASGATRPGTNPTALLLHTSEAQTRRFLRGREEPLVKGPRSMRTTRKSGSVVVGSW
jgi:hypothetical protein